MSPMAGIPSVLFMSCSDVHPDEIIKLVNSDVSEKIQIEDNIHAYPWHIDNKYYNAEVNLCCLQKKSLSTKKFADTVEAAILHFDSSKNGALDTVDSWLPFINEFSPEIKILLCKNVPTEVGDNLSCTKRNVQEWCVDKGFELVELEPIIDEENDDLEDDFMETTGVKRIVQALNAHVWPNLVMKTLTQNMNPSAKPGDANNGLQTLKEQLCLEESLEDLLENDDDFSQLFSQLPELKARVASFSGADRKAAAEQVVKAFWKALGGDDEDEFLNM